MGGRKGPGDRNAVIISLRAQGATLDEIGQAVGLTRERVRQILRDAGGTSTAELRARRRREKDKRAEALRDAVEADLRANPGATVAEIAVRLQLPPRDVARHLSPDLRRLVARKRSTGTRTWSDEAILDAIRKASTYEFPLTVGGYFEVLDKGEVMGPSTPLIYKRFGSWSAACDLAGVECGQVWREYDSTWTDEDLLSYVRDYLANDRYRGTFQGYTPWRRAECPEAPSAPTIRNRLGGWSDIKRRALAPRTTTPSGSEDVMTVNEVPLPSAPTLGAEAARLDATLASSIDDATRAQIWRSAQSILRRGPLGEEQNPVATGLALGFVQSGKTTSITALIADAADSGYRVVVALLGGTNLLLGQNQGRLERALGIGEREDYRWVVETNPGASAAKGLAEWLERGRIVLVPVLKHAGRIRGVAQALRKLDLADVPVLVIDDEADQASLNIQGASSADSKTYAAIKELRSAAPQHLYVQYTATPYAPLLLQADDLLHPDFVEFLHPGPGYTGGREFFVDFADQVVRDVPMLEEQATKALPLELPRTLVDAFASFVAGAALLLGSDPTGAPVSMLVHSTQRNDVQGRYHFLLDRQLAGWRKAATAAMDAPELPKQILAERDRLVSLGAPDAGDHTFLKLVQRVLSEATLWLVNSASALNKVDWKVAPIHILVGGNKLDRGYTVEGLTVTYMNRPPSVQVDTIEQRARAFGYRGDQLPFCQFFATKRTVKVLRDVVFTEYDLRARLLDHVDRGGSIESWATEVGLLLPEGTKPTRDAVVQALSSSLSGWYSLRRPSFDEGGRAANLELLRRIGLLEAERVDYGRLAHRSLEMPLHQLVEEVLGRWEVEGYSPDWRHDDILQVLSRHPDQNAPVPLLLMEDDGGPRTRKWDADTGFINLFQGQDVRRQKGRPFYPGDRAVPEIAEAPDRVAVQFHRLVRRGDERAMEVVTPAVYLGSRKIVRKA